MTVRIDECIRCGSEFEQELKQGRPFTLCETCRTPKPKASPAPTGRRGRVVDPPVRADGRCARCRRPRKLTEAARRYAGVQVDLDPFCSTECCRIYHGISVFSGTKDEDLAARRSSLAQARSEELEAA